MPILPFYAREYGASGTVLGLILASYAAAQFVCAPLLGRLSDRIGRRPVMLLTIAGTGLSLLFLGLATSLPQVLLARVLAGGFAANISVASAYITDVTAEDERTRWMGMLGASFGVGFVLGPAIGGGLVTFGIGVPMLFAAGLAGLNLLFAATRLVEPPGHAHLVAARDRRAVLRQPMVFRLCVGNFGFAMGVTQLETVFAYLMIDRFDYGAMEVAFILVAMAVVMGGIQGGAMRSLAARYPERSMVAAGTLLLAIAFALIPLAGSVPILLVPLLIASVGRAIAQPSLVSLVSMAASPDERGAVMGVFQSGASLARIIGPLLAGALYDRALAAPFVLASLVFLAVSLLARVLPAREPSRPSDDAVSSESWKEPSYRP